MNLYLVLLLTICPYRHRLHRVPQKTPNKNHSINPWEMLRNYSTVLCAMAPTKYKSFSKRSPLCGQNAVVPDHRSGIANPLPFMPKPFQIEAGGATEAQIDEIVDEFLKLRVNRERQPVLVFDAEGAIQSYKRTSNGEWFFGTKRVKDRASLRDCVAHTLNRRGTVLVGLVEGSAAKETLEVFAPRDNP